MGIKYFQKWLYSKFPECFYEKESFRQKIKEIEILGIDLNGIFYSCVQNLGISKKRPFLLNSNAPSLQEKDNLLFLRISQKIKRIVQEIKPTNALILCMDGVAGLGKIQQQRQRRYRSSFLDPKRDFDTNSFSPGTELMNELSCFLEKWIGNQVEHDPLWKILKVIFSSEKIAGEGEHKVFEYLNRYEINGKEEMNIVIYGIDSDLIMISLLRPLRNIFIMKEYEEEINYIDISTLRKKITENMLISNKLPESFHPFLALCDFVFISFFIGNDFLPCLPTMDIMDGFYEHFFSAYRHFFNKRKKHLIYSALPKRYEKKEYGFLGCLWDELILFLTIFSHDEKKWYEDRYNDPRHSFFPDPLILRFLNTDKNQFHHLHFIDYKKEYYKEKFTLSSSSGNHEKLISKEYIKGMIWNLNYYYHSIPDWCWYYSYNHAPYLSDIMCFLKSTRTFSLVFNFQLNKPIDPICQLLLILPPTSCDLLPPCFQTLFLEKPDSFPQSIQIDVTGKKKEWEGIVCLPPVPFDFVLEYYKSKKNKLNESEKKRNEFIENPTFFYNKSAHTKKKVSFFH